MTQAGMPRSTSVRPALPIMAAIVALTALVFFWKLDQVPLTNWDEGIHSSVALETFQKNNWLSLTYHDQLYTAKPPLKFWLTAPLFFLFGPSEFAARFWSAVAGLGTVLVLMLWIWRVSSSRGQVALAAGIFLTGRFVFDHSFRTGETDGLFIFFTTLALYAYWRSWEKPRWLLASGAAIGLAVMTKSFGGLLPAIIIGLDYVVSARWRQLSWKIGLQSAGLAVLIAAPWHLFEIARHGQTFWSQYFGFHVVDRTKDVLYGNTVPWYWYWLIIRQNFFPFSSFFFLAVAWGALKSVWSRDALHRLLMIWVTVVFAAFTLVQTKFAWYILPIYPALAFLMARMAGDLWARSQTWLITGWLASFAFMIYLMPPRFTRSGWLWHLTPYAYLPPEFNQTDLGRLGVAAALTLVILLLVWSVSRAYRWPIGKVLVGGTISYLLFLSLAWSGLMLKNAPTRSAAKDMAVKVQERGITELYQQGLDEFSQPAAYFYLRRIPVTLRYSTAPDFVPNAHILTTNKPANVQLISSGEILLQRGNFVLLKTGPSSLP